MKVDNQDLEQKNPSAPNLTIKKDSLKTSDGKGEKSFFTDLKMKDFVLRRELGKGSYGVVSLVEVRGKLYALKQVDKQ